jgi:hypothetical protein
VSTSSPHQHLIRSNIGSGCTTSEHGDGPHPGLTQYVQWVNTSFAVFNESTGAVVYGPAAGNTLWTGFGGQCELQTRFRLLRHQANLSHSIRHFIGQKSVGVYHPLATAEQQRER